MSYTFEGMRLRLWSAVAITAAFLVAGIVTAILGMTGAAVILILLTVGGICGIVGGVYVSRRGGGIH
jgi:hypothetical protein